MPFLIDGYNLLNVADVPVPVRGKAGLEKARLALLNFLAESLAPEDVPRTVVVFDAHDPPPGLPRETRHKGLVVLFAAREEDADSLIEDLILADDITDDEIAALPTMTAAERIALFSDREYRFKPGPA